jgi:hypothetical protein
MNELLYKILLQIGTYLIVFFATIILFNFFTKSFLFTYLVVKASRGNKLLIRVLSYTGFYYRTGKLDNGVLQFKNKLKNIDSYKINKLNIYSEMGVNVIYIDETTKKVLSLDGSSEEGHDTEKFQSLLQRALYRPTLKDDFKNIAVLVLCVLNLIVSSFIIYTLLTTFKVGSSVGVV